MNEDGIGIDFGELHGSAEDSTPYIENLLHQTTTAADSDAADLSQLLYRVELQRQGYTDDNGDGVPELAHYYMDESSNVLPELYVLKQYSLCINRVAHNKSAVEQPALCMECFVTEESNVSAHDIMEDKIIGLSELYIDESFTTNLPRAYVPVTSETSRQDNFTPYAVRMDLEELKSVRLTLARNYYYQRLFDNMSDVKAKINEQCMKSSKAIYNSKAPALKIRNRAEIYRRYQQLCDEMLQFFVKAGYNNRDFRVYLGRQIK